MQQFKFFEDKSTKIIRKIITSGSDLGRIKPNMMNFMRYMSSDFDSNMKRYDSDVNISSINLDTIIDVRFRFLLKGVELKKYVSFIQELHSRMGDFKGKEGNLRVVIGIYFLYYVLVIKIVEIYLGAISTYIKSDKNAIKYNLKDIGIDNKILKHFIGLGDLRTKTIDEWLSLDLDAVEERYIMSALRRILIVLGASAT